MANDTIFTQASTILNQIVGMATGKTAIMPANTSEFVNVAQLALLQGYDPVLNAISQVISRTIISARRYTRKFRGLEMSMDAWGNHVRKLQFADKDFTDDLSYKYPVTWDSTQNPPSGDGMSVDQWKIRKPDILQTNFYGNAVFQDYITFFKDQLDVSFTSPTEFMRYLSGLMMEIDNKREQAVENIARGTLVNLIGGVLAENDNNRVVRLLTEYNTETGQNLTKAEVMQAENYKAFYAWTYAFIAKLSALFTERSTLFQTKINNKNILHHTPYRDQKVYLYAPVQYQSSAMVLANTFNDKYLKLTDFEVVNFWQSINTPDAINIRPAYTNTTGEVTIPTNSVEQSNIWGVIFDREAAGYAITNEWSKNTGLNAAGGYSNMWWHTTFKAFNDNTEKAIVLLLE